MLYIIGTREAIKGSRAYDAKFTVYQIETSKRRALKFAKELRFHGHDGVEIQTSDSRLLGVYSEDFCRWIEYTDIGGMKVELA